MKNYTLALLILILSSMFSVSYANATKPPPPPYHPVPLTTSQGGMQKQQNQNSVKKPVVSQKNATATKAQ